MEKKERFSVEEYLKSPSRKVVTGTGKAARIVCCDVRSTYPVVAAVDEFAQESIGTYTEDGRFFESREDARDLYFADAVERFDPTELNPFDKVLVRYKGLIWVPAFFSAMRSDASGKYDGVYSTEGNGWDMCVPYNSKTEWLLGTDKDSPEYYKWWED